jgi:YVTN family beta-propeller protein
VYVTNEGSGDLSIIDGDTGSIAATLPIGKRPRGLAASSDGRNLYIALSGTPASPHGAEHSEPPAVDKAADGIGVFSIAEQRLERVLPGVSDPEQLAVDRRGERLYVASEDTGALVVLAVNGEAAPRSIPVGGEPEGVALTRDGRFAYVTSEAARRVVVVDTEDGAVVARIEVGLRPRGLALTRDGATLFVTNELDHSISIVDTTHGTMRGAIAMPRDTDLPMGIAVAPDGNRIYVTTGRGGTLLAFDPVSRELIGQTHVGERPWGVALSPDGRRAYTANGPSNDVGVVDTATMTLVATIPVGTRPWGVIVVEQ